MLGWSQAKLPYEVIGKGVTLKLQDAKGNWWRTLVFYPNVVNGQRLIETQTSRKDAAISQPTLALVRRAFADEPLVAGQEVKFNNCAEPINKLSSDSISDKWRVFSSDRIYYKWRVFVDEPQEDLNKIEEVQYLLHPTFPEPLHVRNNPGDGFSVEASGCGEFWIQITITYKDGANINTRYHLDLSKRCKRTHRFDSGTPHRGDNP